MINPLLHENLATARTRWSEHDFLSYFCKGKNYPLQGWWFQIFFGIFTHTWRRWTHFDSYIFNGLKPPTSSYFKCPVLLFPVQPGIVFASAQQAVSRRCRWEEFGGPKPGDCVCQKQGFLDHRFDEVYIYIYIYIRTCIYRYVYIHLYIIYIYICIGRGVVDREEPIKNATYRGYN